MQGGSPIKSWKKLIKTLCQRKITFIFNFQLPPPFLKKITTVVKLKNQVSPNFDVLGLKSCASNSKICSEDFMQKYFLIFELLTKNYQKMHILPVHPKSWVFWQLLKNDQIFLHKIFTLYLRILRRNFWAQKRQIWRNLIFRLYYCGNFFQKWRRELEIKDKVYFSFV